MDLHFSRLVSLLSGLALAAGGLTSAAPVAAAVVAPVPASAGHILAAHTTAPLSTTECEQTFGIHCYSPLQYRAAYNLGPLYRQGITGRGRTIVIVDSFGSPTIQHDLDVFDQQWGLPSTTVQIVRWGDVPAFDPTNSDMTGWAGETSLDVEYAHAIAPDAHLVLVETAVSETEGVTGLPEMMSAEKALIDRGVPDVISQSFGATENTFPGYGQGDFRSLLNLRYAFADAAAHRVTVLGASGDDGATDYESDLTTVYPYRVNSWPSSDPLVTSVGGSQLTLDDNGARTAPDTAWNDGYGAGGGGVSGVFARPPFQAGVTNVVGPHRGTPDISMSAAVDGGCWVYSSYDPNATGWDVYGGTSEATPIFSGVVALAAQAAGHRLGWINPTLYRLGALTRGPSGRSTGVVDITSGTNSFGGVTGYAAGPGYDLASGWGTVDATAFVWALARS